MAKSLFFSIFLAYTTCIFGNLVEQGMNQISTNDRICMQVFFDHAIKHNQAAHILYFNNKPMCIICIALIHKDKTFKDILALKGWIAFKKNEYLFPHPKFIFSQAIFEAGSDCIILHIYFINKESLAKCIDDHLSFFQALLGPEFSSVQFIAQLEKGNSLTSLLNHDEMLLGLLLGYGKESSDAFKKMRAQYTQTIAPPQTNNYSPINLKRPKGCKIDPIVFMGNPHSPEVKQLISAYEKELEEAWSEYHHSKESLKAVLERLCAE